MLVLTESFQFITRYSLLLKNDMTKQYEQVQSIS